jgi:hypothetical protein
VKRIFYGLVCVQVSAPGKIDQHNECWFDVASSKDEALGRWSKLALAKHSGGVIAWMDAYDITDAARSAISMIAAAPATDAGEGN